MRKKRIAGGGKKFLLLSAENKMGSDVVSGIQCIERFVFNNGGIVHCSEQFGNSLPSNQLFVVLDDPLITLFGAFVVGLPVAGFILRRILQAVGV